MPNNFHFIIPHGKCFHSQLGQVVRRDVGTIPLELVQLETAGLVLRWSPMEGPDTHHITLADVDHLIHSLHHQLVRS